MASIASDAPSVPISCAQGRNGVVIIAQDGRRPLRWAGSGAAVAAGVDPPESPPICVLDETPNYHIARIDVAKPGAVYYSPPTVTLSEDGLSPEKGRKCKAKAYLSQASVNEILVEDGGKYYSSVPNVILGNSHGKNAVIEAPRDVIDTPFPGNSDTGVTGYQIVSLGPPWDDEQALPDFQKTVYAVFKWVDIELRNGNQTVTGARWTFSAGTIADGRPHVIPIQMTTQVTVTGVPPGVTRYAKVRVHAADSAFTGNTNCSARQNATGGWSIFHDHTASFLFLGGCSTFGDVTALDYGEGYIAEGQTDNLPDIRIEIPAWKTVNPNTGFYGPGDPNKSLFIRGYTGEDPRNPGGAGASIARLEVVNPGSGYIVTPEIQIVSSTGFGAYGTVRVEDGQIVEAILENPGGGYKTDPVVRILSGGAEASVVARAHLRGIYQCYYRYIDGTPDDFGGPIPSNLSEVAEVDAGEAATSIAWSVAAPSGRAEKVELWRTTGNQALTLYRVATLEADEVDGFIDDLTDEELRDPDRDGYEAMPIVLPNGELNANRFVPPPKKSVVVRFQDRYWYGVGGDNPNAVFFSETDEPESVPDINEIIPQQSGKGDDSLTALIPFGTTLMLMQSRHAYSLTFARQPLLDAQVAPTAYRGCVNQRTWDIYDGVLYVMDHHGIYAMSQSGQVKSISDPVEDQFRSKINWAASRWSFLAVDPKTKTLRAFVSHADDLDNTYPTRALCFSLDSQSWWYETYPQRITGACQALLSSGEQRYIYAAEGGAMLLDEGRSDIARGTVLSVRLQDSGGGYIRPPTVQASGGHGARFQATLDDMGRVSAIWILSGGYNYESGSLTISPPENQSNPNAATAVATYVASSLSEDESVSPFCIYRGGFVEYNSDAPDSRAEGEQDRSISLTYAPQEIPSEVSVRMYYNGSRAPRPNIVARDRGTGVRQDSVDPAARISVGAQQDPEFVDAPGVSTAMFSGTGSSDFRGADRHVSVELAGPRRSEEPLVLYKLDVFGAGR